MIGKALKFPQKFLFRIFERGPVDTYWWLKNYIDTRQRERRFGVSTTAVLRPEELGYAPDAPGYDPINYADLDAILNDLMIDPERDIFVDIGSGLGRAVIMAATRPFKEVIGIELNKGLYEASLRQLNHVRNDLACKNVRIEQADAMQYDFPEHASVLFMWNPFVGEILEAVMERIRLHQEKYRNPTTLIYAIPYNDKDTLQGRPWLRDRREIKARFWTGVRVIRYKVDSAYSTNC